MHQAEIRRKLRENSRRAQEDWLRALRRFEEVKRSVPLSVPLPDDVRIPASRAYTEALQAHREAVRLGAEFSPRRVLPSGFWRS